VSTRRFAVSEGCHVNPSPTFRPDRLATLQSLRYVSVSCERLADVHRGLEPVTAEHLQQAATYLQESLGHWATMRERFGEVPDMLQGPHVPLTRLAVILLMVGQRESAQILLVADSENLETMVARNWATPSTRGKLKELEHIESLLERMPPAGTDASP